MLRLDAISLVWAFFVQEKRRIHGSTKRRSKRSGMKKSLR